MMYRLTLLRRSVLPVAVAATSSSFLEKKEKKEMAIGIDLGTTYSCCGVWNRETRSVDIIPSFEGNRTTPSYVAFTPERLVGDAAKSQAARNATNTVFDAKRLVGRRFDDATVKKDAKLWPFSVVPGEGGKAMIKTGDGKKHHPEEISGAVLSSSVPKSSLNFYPPRLNFYFLTV